MRENDYKDLKKELGKKESSGNYKSINPYGYWGKYQFGKARLKDLGYEDISRDEFLNNSDLQEEIFEKHVDDVLQRFLKPRGGAGSLIWGAHLGGDKGERQVRLHRGNPKDKLGTSVLDYMREGDKFDLSQEFEIVRKDKLTKVERRLGRARQKVKRLKKRDNLTKQIVKVLAKIIKRFTKK